MAPYVEEVWKLQRRFNSFRAAYVSRNENTVADELSQLASRQDPVPPGVYIEVLRHPSVSLERHNSKSTATPGAGDPATSTPRVTSPEGAEDPASSSMLQSTILELRPVGHLIAPSFEVEEGELGTSKRRAKRGRGDLGSRRYWRFTAMVLRLSGELFRQPGGPSG